MIRFSLPTDLNLLSSSLMALCKRTQSCVVLVVFLKCRRTIRDNTRGTTLKIQEIPKQAETILRSQSNLEILRNPGLTANKIEIIILAAG